MGCEEVCGWSRSGLNEDCGRPTSFFNDDEMPDEPDSSGLIRRFAWGGAFCPVGGPSTCLGYRSPALRSCRIGRLEYRMPS